jgi:pyridoxamine 5'-phosphate oxidase
MIDISNICNEEPYLEFIKFYEKAIEKKQKSVEAISISSFNKILNEVDSRYVNLKYIKKNEWIFFTNYLSPKADQFLIHNQIAASFYWPKVDIQIRIKAKIFKTDEFFCDDHFASRSIDKNALAISSFQSMEISSYEKVIENYNNQLRKSNKLLSRPSNWGGFSFTPYYFEFWEGHKTRLNKRVCYELFNTDWKKKFLQP